LEEIVLYKSVFAQTSLFVVLLTASVHAQGFDVPDTPESGFLSSPTDLDEEVSEVNQESIDGITNKKMRRFKVSPYASATATYSDNIELSPDNSKDKESGMIYGAGVGLNAAYESRRLDAIAGVNVTQAWRGNDTSQTLPTANAGISSELISNLFFLDALGSVQALRDDALAVNSFSGAGNGNYETYLQGSVSPYLRHQFGKLAVGELRYGYDYGGGSTDTVGTVQSHTYKASLGTSDNASRLNINGSTSYTDIGYEDQFGDSNDSTQLTNEVTTTYALTHKVTLIGQIGHDKVETVGDDAYSDDLTGLFYNGGLQYRPTERLRMTGRYGRRHNTQYYALDGNYNVTKRVFIGATAMTQLLTAIPVGYQGNIAPGTALSGVQKGESLASQLDNRLPGATTVGNVGQTILGNQENSQIYISSSVNAYLGTELSSGSAGLALGYETRDYNTAQDEVITTATANYRHDFNKKISATLEGFYYSLESLIANTNDTYGARLLGNYALNNTVNLFAAVGRTERTAEFVDAEFTEHNATIGISTQF
jgi:uncharacterized protein (PEP-CTERM system associated)